MEADVTLMELLEGLYDPRAPKGKRHPSLPCSLDALTRIVDGLPRCPLHPRRRPSILAR